MLAFELQMRGIMNRPWLAHRYVIALGMLLLAACGQYSTQLAPDVITVTAVSPNLGSVVGGTSVTITGVNFIDVTSVTIGGSALRSRTVVSPTQITGATPAATSLGAADVVVTSSSHGNGTCSGCFSYEPISVLAQPLAAGAFHTCGITSAGAAFGWGDNYYGQLGNGSNRSSATPVAVSGGLSFLAITAGGDHTCGLTTC